MFKKVLFPTDFSDKSHKTMDYIKQMKGAGTEEVILLHVIDKREIKTKTDMEGFSSLRYKDIKKEITEEMKSEANIKLSDAFSELHESGIDVTKRLEIGIPFTKIVNIAEEEEVSCVVLGSHGKGLVEEMLLGSTSEKVIRNAHCPVFVIK